MWVMLWLVLFDFNLISFPFLKQSDLQPAHTKKEIVKLIKKAVNLNSEIHIQSI